MSQFKNSMGVRLTQGLFYETTLRDKSSVVYTLKRDDHEGFPSLYRLYMETADPTEYRFAVAYLDGWEHWEQLTQSPWFKPYIEAWRRELDIKLRSEALAGIIADSKNEKSQNAYHARKYLLDGSWKPTGERKVGRTTKDAIKREAAQLVSQGQEINDDYNRLLNDKVN